MAEETKVEKTPEEKFAEDLFPDPVDDPTADKESDKEPDEEKDKEPGEENDEEPDKEPEKKEEEEEPEPDLTPEEVEKLPKDAKGLYYALKKERGKSKQAEAERDYLAFQKKYGGNKEPKEEEKEEELANRDFETVDDILKDKEDDDLPTAGELRRIEIARENEKKYQEKIKGTKVSKEEAKRKEATDRMNALEDSFKATHPDYDEVFGIYKEVLKEFPTIHLKVMAELDRENGNPAKLAYEIGKKFRGVYGKGKPANGKPAGDITRIEKNAEKKPSSGSIPGSSVSDKALAEMDKEELVETLNAMTPEQFWKVPKRIRESVLR